MQRQIINSHTFVTSFSAFILCFSSCKKCIKCDCVKSEQISVEENCAYGGGSSNDSQETWKQFIIEEKGCEELNCVEVN